MQRILLAYLMLSLNVALLAACNIQPNPNSLPQTADRTHDELLKQRVKERLKSINENPNLKNKSILLDVAYMNVLEHSDGAVTMATVGISFPGIKGAGKARWDVQGFSYLVYTDETKDPVLKCAEGRGKLCEDQLPQIALSAYSSAQKALAAAKYSKPCKAALSVASYDYRIESWASGSWYFIFGSDPATNCMVAVDAKRYHVLWINPKSK